MSEWVQRHTRSGDQRCPPPLGPRREAVSESPATLSSQHTVGQVARGHCKQCRFGVGPVRQLLLLSTEGQAQADFQPRGSACIAADPGPMRGCMATCCARAREQPPTSTGPQHSHRRPRGGPARVTAVLNSAKREPLLSDATVDTTARKAPSGSRPQTRAGAMGTAAATRPRAAAHAASGQKATPWEAIPPALEAGACHDQPQTGCPSASRDSCDWSPSVYTEVTLSNPTGWRQRRTSPRFTLLRGPQHRCSLPPNLVLPQRSPRTP